MQRPLQIAFKDMDSSEFLEGTIRKHVQRLERLNPAIVGCRVVVETPRRSSESAKPPLGLAVEVEVPGRPTIVARSAEERRDAKDDHTAVINRTFDAVQRQLESIADQKQGEAKQHESAGETGMVVRLFPKQGYGFIEVKGSPELHFTAAALTGDGFAQLRIGTMVQVTRAAGEGPMGPRANSVKLLDHRRSPARA